jgi:hypothetical protein
LQLYICGKGQGGKLAGISLPAASSIVCWFFHLPPVNPALGRVRIAEEKEEH